MPEEDAPGLDKDSLYAVSSSTRIEILKLLIEKKQLTVTDIAKKLNLSKSTVHEHIEKLQAAGLITKSEHTGKKWIYYKPTWQGQSLFPKKGRMQINIAISVVLMIGITVVMAAVLYVWASGLASTGGSAPPAFSVTASDSQDKTTTFIDPTTPWKDFISITGSTASPGAALAPRPYNGTAAFIARYYSSNGSVAHETWHVNITFRDDNGTQRTAHFTMPSDSEFVNVSLTALGGVGGIAQVSAISVTGESPARTLSSNQTIALSTNPYDTIVDLVMSNGMAGSTADITTLGFYIKVGGSGEWIKLTPNAGYKTGAVVLDNAVVDARWGLGETVHISETAINPHIIGASQSSQGVYVRIVHEPSQSTIYASANPISVL